MTRNALSSPSSLFDASISKVTDLISEIATSSNEQAQGIAQMNLGLGQIDKVIQSNTASAEECAATSEELSSHSAQMKQQLDRFILSNCSIPNTVMEPKIIEPRPANIAWAGMEVQGDAPVAEEEICLD